VGINLNQTDGSFIEIDSEHSFNIVTLSPDGRPV